MAPKRSRGFPNIHLIHNLPRDDDNLERLQRHDPLETVDRPPRCAMFFDRHHVAQKEQRQHSGDGGEQDRPNEILFQAFSALVVYCPSIPSAAYRAIYAYDVQGGGKHYVHDKGQPKGRFSTYALMSMHLCSL